MAPTPSATCRAPHVGLRFSPDGHVHACCVNDSYPLGHVATDGLRDIWEGKALARLRAALDGGVYGLGCQDCEREHLIGARGGTHAAAYDDFEQPVTPLTWPKRVEFALSNTCNLRCTHCNGDLSSAIRSQREHREPLPASYGESFFAQLPELLAHIEVAVFIGGEPFLAREARRVWDLLIDQGLTPEVHVTTNGTVWDDRVEHYLRSLRMNVAVSIDGATPATNEALRVGIDHGDLLANRDRFLEVTRSYGGSFGLNHCLLVDNWRELAPFLVEGDRLDVPVRVIPVMYPGSMSLFSLPPEELTPVLDELAAAPEAATLGRNRSVWEATMAHLWSHHDQLTGRGRAVTITGRPPRRPPETTIQAISDELAAWAGQSPVVLRTEYQVLVAVEEPLWAAPLGLGELRGRPMAEVAAEVDARLGPMFDVEHRDAPPGVEVLCHRRRIGGAEVDFRTAVVAEWGVLTATRAPVDRFSSLEG